MTRIGIVGIGFMGMIHFLAARKLKGAKVTALCSRDPRKLAGDWRGIRGNFGPPGTVMDTSRLKKYQRLDDLLADPHIDLVDICNPTDLHAATAIAALRAGKHVLVEKAIALAPREADAMIAAARKARRLLLVAHVLPFVPEFGYAADAVRKKTFGRLLGGHFWRIISRPDWSADIADPARTGGPAIDLHIHDTHFIGLLAGVPRRVFSSGLVDHDTVQYLTTHYLYDGNGPALTCSSGAVAQKAREFVHGFEIYLERATLVHSSDGKPLTVLHASGKSEQPRLKGGGDILTAFTTELQLAADAAATGKEPDLLSGQLARDALVLCHRECQSVRTGKPVAIG